jgi:hypothetical protein
MLARDNHYLDCEAMAAAAAYLLNAQYLRGAKEDETPAVDDHSALEVASIDSNSTPTPAAPPAARMSQRDKFAALAARLNR